MARLECRIPFRDSEPYGSRREGRARTRREAVREPTKVYTCFKDTDLVLSLA